MARVNLADMDLTGMPDVTHPAEVAGEGPGPSPEVTESVPAVPVKKSQDRVVALKATPVKEQPQEQAPVADPAPSDPVDRPGPKYQSLDRKETFLWPDQRDDLNTLQHRLNRTRGPGNGERITANTLIRIAIDLLLERQGDLVGVSENDLRAAVGLPVREVVVGE